MVFFYCGIVSVRLLLEINLTPIEKFMPSSIRFILTNKVIELINKCTAMVTDGSFDEVTLPFEVPSEPGVYEYSFQPYMVQTDPLTGEEVRFPAGKPVSFTVMVGEDGSVEIRYE